jgi:hypothetical protein
MLRTIMYVIMHVILYMCVNYEKESSTQPKIMVVLGCGMEEIQNDRIITAINYAENVGDNSQMVWYLTGGVKNAVTKTQTEASKMKAQLGDANSKIVLDEKATNTAENFAYLKKWIEETYDEQMQKPQIVITTSAFHKERAEKIFNGIFNDGIINNGIINNGIINDDNNYPVMWNLSNGACTHCWNDEKIHIKNVNNDVEKAKKVVYRELNN